MRRAASDIYDSDASGRSHGRLASAAKKVTKGGGKNSCLACRGRGVLHFCSFPEIILH